MNIRWTPYGIVVFGALVGCGPAGGDAGEPTSSVKQPIANEQLGGVAEAVWRAYSNADVARASYAAPALFASGAGENSCSAAMVGPNIMITAAHCGGPPQTYAASFLVYPNGNTTDKVWENFTCNELYQTWFSADLAVYYCAPDASGKNPGDVYGYFDIDPTPPSVGDSVYSIWANPLDNPAPGWPDVRFYSTGEITATNITSSETQDPGHDVCSSTPGAAPIEYQNALQPYGIGTNMWANGGCSGSPWISAKSNRLVAGPTSHGSTDAPGRDALSWAQYFTNGTVAVCGDVVDTIGTAEVSSLGLDPFSYEGLIDKNYNGVLDIQEAIERDAGEGARDWYAFSWTHARQNLLWDRGPSPNSVVTFYTDLADHEVHMAHTAPGQDVAMTHSRLNLAPGTYRVTFGLYTGAVNGSTASSNAYDLVASFSGGGWAGQTNAFPTNPAAGWTTQTYEVTIPAGLSTPASLSFSLTGSVDVWLSTLSIVADDAVMDFDTMDKRYNWRNDATGGTGLVVPFVPVGTNPGTPASEITQVNWVGRVDYDSAHPFQYQLRNLQLALPAGVEFTLCFDTATPPGAAQQWGFVQWASSGTVVSTLFFQPPATGWSHVCLPAAAAPTSASDVHFGIAGAGSYVVDNIRFH